MTLCERRTVVFGSVGRWGRQHWALLAAGSANLIFVFLPFYDANNIPLALTTASHFNSSAPAFTASTWVAGPFINADYLPQYLAYVASGYQLYWAYTVLKLSSFGMTCVLTWVLFRIFRERDEALAYRVALFTLANPIWIYVNYIWTEYDIFPVTFLAIGFVLLRYTRWGTADRYRVPVGLLCIMVSVFFYWFALAIVPTLIFYARDPAERIRTAVYSAIFFLILIGATVVLLAGNLLLDTSTLLGTNTQLNRAHEFGLHFFVPFTPVEYAVFLLALVIPLPLLLRQIGVPEVPTAFVVLSALIFSAPIPLPDNYVAIFPFALLSLLAARRQCFNWASVVGLLAFPITGLLLISLYIGNAQPDGVGIFFWGFDLFHLDIHFLPSTPAVQGQYLLWYNILVGVSITLSLLVLAWVVHTSARVGNSGAVPTPDRSVAANGAGVIRQRLPGRSPSRVGSLAILLVILAVASLAFNAAYPTSALYDGSDTPPTYFLTPIFVPDNGNIVRPIPNATYSESGSTFVISRNAPPMMFGRWYGSQGFTMSGSVALNGTLPQTAPIVNGTPFNVSLLNFSQPDEETSQWMSPTGLQGVTNDTVPQDLLSATHSAYDLTGNSTVLYNLTPDQFLDRYYVLAFEPQNATPVSSTILDVKNSENFFSVVTLAGEDLLEYGGVSNSSSVPVAVPIPGTVDTGVWNYLVFEPTSSGLWVDLSGRIVHVNVGLFPPGSNEQVRLGTPSSGGEYGDAFLGLSTGLYASETEPKSLNQTMVVVSVAGHVTYFPLSSPNVEFSVASSSTGSRLDIANESFETNLRTTAFYVGKLSPGQYELTFDLTSYRMTQLGPDRYYLVPVFWTFVGPYVVLVGAVRWFGRAGVLTTIEYGTTVLS